MGFLTPDFLDKNLPAQERSQDLMDWIGVPSTVGAIMLGHPALTALGLIAGMHMMQGKGNGVPMQQGDNGDYYGPKGQRTRMNHDEAANVILGEY